MSIEHEITKKAAEGGLTIADLREFLEEFDKATATAGPPSHTGTYRPKVRAGFSGGIKSISVTIPGGGEQS